MKTPFKQLKRIALGGGINSLGVREPRWYISDTMVYEEWHGSQSRSLETAVLSVHPRNNQKSDQHPPRQHILPEKDEASNLRSNGSVYCSALSDELASSPLFASAIEKGGDLSWGASISSRETKDELEWCGKIGT